MAIICFAMNQIGNFFQNLNWSDNETAINSHSYFKNQFIPIGISESFHFQRHMQLHFKNSV